MRLSPAVAIVMLFGLPAAHAAPCDVFRTARDLDSALDAAESAFERRQLDALVTAEHDAVAVIPCLREAVSTSLAARVHRIEGYSAFLKQESDAAQSSFSAARGAEPAFLLPTTVVPLGHPMRVLYDAASLLPAAVEPLPATSGTIRLDGRTALDRPMDRPALIQHFDPAGGVTLSVLLAPAQPLPTFPPPQPEAETVPLDRTGPAVEPGTVVALPGTQRASRRQPPTGVVVAIGTGAGVAALLYGAAFILRSEYDALDDAEASLDDLESLYAANHGLVIASGVTGGLSLAAGITAFSVRW